MLASQTHPTPYRSNVQTWGMMPSALSKVIEEPAASATEGLVPLDKKGLTVTPIQSRVAVLDGPEELFAKIVAAWQVEQFAEKLLGANTGDKRRVKGILSGFDRLKSRDEKDRVGELFRIFAFVHSLFRTRENELAFMHTRQDALGDTPLSLILEGSFDNLRKVRQFVQSLANY